VSGLAEIRARRERLLARSAAQREELALLARAWRGPLEITGRGVAAVRYVREHPGALVLAAAVLVALSPKRAFRWARRAVLLWRGYRWALGALERLSR
jgi:hypothetical protein